MPNVAHRAMKHVLQGSPLVRKFGSRGVAIAATAVPLPSFRTYGKPHELDDNVS